MLRGRHIGASALLLCAAALAPGAASAAMATVPAAPTLKWTDCGDGVQCSKAKVPLDYTKPSGRKITLALARRTAPDPSKRIGSLFVNPGGPGGSGIDDVRAFQAGGPTNQRFDIVGFDPRGVGQSRPAIDCVSDRELDRRLAAVPSSAPKNLDLFLAQGDSFARACRRHTPAALLRHVSTAETARDLDLLRRAVGEKRLTYVGESYGTEIGAVYASLFPKRVRALVLDGGIDHHLWSTDPFGWDLAFARGNQAALKRFFGFCGASPGECPFAGGADPRVKYNTLIQRLEGKPAPGTSSDPRKVDGTLARTATLAAMHDRDAWPALGVGLDRARAGDGTILRAIADALTGRSPKGHYSSFLEANEVVTANDGKQPSPRSAYERHLRRLNQAAPQFADLLMTLDTPRRTLPVSPAAYRKPLSYPGSSPTILVVGSTGDNATPYSTTRALARQLGNARLLTRVGDGHTAFTKSNCIAGYIRAYVIDGILPPAGTRCQPGT
jgi:pimeloyl-ACP methyl ester carboxylesterase